MVDESDDQHDGATRADRLPAPPPRPMESIRDLEPVDAEFQVIQETIERLLRQELRVVRQEIRAEVFSGPLPHEKTLEAYERIVPGSAGMIFRNFEEQGRHRRQLERYALVWDNRRSFAGLACGLIVTLSFLVVSYLLIEDGHEVAGTILGTVNLVGLVGVFVFGSYVLREERIRKAKIMTGQEGGEIRTPGAGSSE